VLDGFGPGAVHGELDHPVHETNPFRRRQAIGLKEQPDLLAAAGGGRETDPFCDVVVMKLSVQPRGFRQFPEAINRPGEFPVDERDRDAALGDDVPRTRITVTEHRMITGQETGERRLPARVGRWLEGLRSVMESAHERAKGTNGLVIPGSGMRRYPWDIGDRFPAVGVEAVTDGTRRAREADRIQVLKQRHHRATPRCGSTQNDVLAPVGFGWRPAPPDGQGRFIGAHGHSLPARGEDDQAGFDMVRSGRMSALLTGQLLAGADQMLTIRAGTPAEPRSEASTE
jgi:hypothetical protein